MSSTCSQERIGKTRENDLSVVAPLGASSTEFDATHPNKERANRVASLAPFTARPHASDARFDAEREDGRARELTSAEVLSLCSDSARNAVTELTATRALALPRSSIFSETSSISVSPQKDALAAAMSLRALLSPDLRRDLKSPVAPCLLLRRVRPVFLRSDAVSRETSLPGLKAMSESSRHKAASICRGERREERFLR